MASSNLIYLVGFFLHVAESLTTKLLIKVFERGFENQNRWSAGR